MNDELTIDQALQIAVGYHQALRFGEAEELYRKVLSVVPQHADALHLLGLIAGQTGHHTQAIDLIRLAINASAKNPDFHRNLGVFLQASGQFELASHSYQQTLALKPDDAEAHFGLGVIAVKQGQLDRAMAMYDRTMELRPQSLDWKAVFELGSALEGQGKIEKAFHCYQQTLQVNPQCAAAAYNLANIFAAKGETEKAISHYQLAIKIDPSFFQASNNFASLLFSHGEIDAAIAQLRAAISLNPHAVETHSSLLMMLQYHPQYDAAVLAYENRSWNQQHALPLAHLIEPHLQSRDADRRLRIGYVSADLCDHPVARFILPLLAAHDRTAVEIFCYANGTISDQMTKNLQNDSDHWRKISDESDEVVAQMIRRDQIDILVDLSLHSAGNRLLVFARKPAPVQVTFAGYPGSTGLTIIDYRLTDPYLDPPENTNQFYSEKSVRLPDTFWCSNLISDEPAVNALPFFEVGHITFGSLNNFRKVNDVTLSLWAALLKAVPGSQLLMQVPSGRARAKVLDRLLIEKIESDRVEFVGHQSRADYLKTYHRIDIGLDTWPYNGHSTSFDALWMGVPVITLVGKTVVGRAGFSQLMNLGLGELVAYSHEDYLRIAIELANEPQRLAALRLSLRQRMQKSPLTQTEKFARGIETAYQKMWQTYLTDQMTTV